MSMPAKFVSNAGPNLRARPLLPSFPAFGGAKKPAFRAALVFSEFFRAVRGPKSSELLLFPLFATEKASESDAGQMRVRSESVRVTSGSNPDQKRITSGSTPNHSQLKSASMRLTPPPAFLGAARARLISL